MGINDILIILTEEEWIKVIQLVEQKSAGHFANNQNEYDAIKTKMLFQLRYGKDGVKE